MKEIKPGLWSGLPVPWTNEEQLDHRVFRETLIRCGENSAGIYIGGTTGEFHSMDESQYASVVKAFTETMRAFPQVGIQVGCGASSLHQVLRRIQISVDAGCSDIQLPLPGWLTLTDDETMEFYAAVAKRFPGVQIIVYDNKSSGRNIGMTLWPHLLKAVPTICGAKMATLDTETVQAIRSVRPDFHFFAVETNFPQFWPLGIGSVAAWMTYSFPTLITGLLKALQENNHPKITELSSTFQKTDQIKEPLRKWGYRGGMMDRLMGLATGYLDPAFHRVLKPWRSVDPSHVADAREQVRKILGPEYLL